MQGALCERRWRVHVTHAAPGVMGAPSSIDFPETCADLTLHPAFDRMVFKLRKVVSASRSMSNVQSGGRRGSLECPCPLT